VTNQCLVRFNLMWLRLNSSLHTYLTGSLSARLATRLPIGCRFPLSRPH
jgi:hypothetical protein